MEKLEYIPGDLLFFGGEKEKVKVELYNPKAGDSIFIRTIEDGDKCRILNASIKKEIIHIPLTPEILEKNGWNKRTRTCYDGEHLEDFSNPSFPLEHFAIAFTKEGIKATYDCLPVREVKYVSDLQHLLFGLGLNSEMEV